MGDIRGIRGPEFEAQFTNFTQIPINCLNDSDFREKSIIQDDLPLSKHTRRPADGCESAIGRGMFGPMKRPLKELTNVVTIALGVVSAGMGLKGFLLSSHFIDGGVTGISMLLAKVLGWPLPVLLLVINLPFIALGYRQLGRPFAIRSASAIIGLSACLATIDFPDVTPDDKLLSAVFGGFFIGAGIGLAIRGGRSSTAPRSPRCWSARRAVCSGWET